MKGFFEGLQTAPIAEIAPGYGLEVLGPHVRRQEVDKRCLENLFLRFLLLVIGGRSTKEVRICGNTASRAELAIGPPVEQGSGAWAGPIGGADSSGDWPSGGRAQDAQPPETQKSLSGGCDGHALREIG
jgi:hypothetical protein